MNRRKVFGLIIIAIGVCIFLYPIVKQTYSAHIQKQLMKEIKAVIKENMSEKNLLENAEEPDLTVTISPSVSESVTDSIQKDYRTLSLTEEESVEEESAQSTQDRLKNQQVIGIIEIEKIDLIYAIVEGTSIDNLGVAIGHMKNTAALGQQGNCALAGHRGGTSGPYFKYLNKLEKGDKIKVTDINGTEYLYQVLETFVVEPSDVWVADNDTEDTILTLITCQDNGSKRLIVRAVMETEE